MTKLSNAALLSAIQQGNNKVLTQLYENYRSPFIAWSKQYFNCEAEEAVDIFQEVVIVFYRNIAQGKLTELTSTVQTYLFAIGKNLLLKKSRQTQPLSLNDNLPLIDNFIIDRQFEISHQKTVLRKTVESLGEPCSEIIKLFYYRNYAIEAIQKCLGYNSESVVRTQKKRCMQYLRKVAKDIENELKP